MVSLISTSGVHAPSHQYSIWTCIIQMSIQGLLTDSKKALTKVSWEGNTAYVLRGYRPKLKDGSKWISS